MRNPAPPLLPIFRSRQQAELLTLLYLHPDREYAVTEAARLLDTPVSTLQREAGRLVEAGILRDRTVGRVRLLSSNGDSALAGPLTDLLVVTYGPRTVVAAEFGDLADVDLVLIYGSWAARYAGRRGEPPHDVDVMVVGSPSRGDVYDAAERARSRLQLPVHPTLSSRRRWHEATDALIQQISSSPFVVCVDRRPPVGETQG